MYFGALKPALNVPIMDDSSGVPGTWDENTATGALSVSSSDTIEIDLASTSELSEIHTKVVVIDNQQMILDGHVQSGLQRPEIHEYPRGIQRIGRI